ncbi:MAG: adenylyl-sulfate kinase [Planctomycetes bacterium]|nr:adenylyl-sulfate kinase [Planctomycetota bacterium]
MVIWLTGLSGSGKSTLAEALAARWIAGGRRVEILDGDALRSALPAQGFDRAARSRNVRTAGWLASRLEAHGVDVICALISPYADDRAWVRERCAAFLEVHVATRLEACRARDPKGLYARVDRGEIRGFTGVDDPYEAPTSPDLLLDTESTSLADCVASLEAIADHSRRA